MADYVGHTTGLPPSAVSLKTEANNGIDVLSRAKADLVAVLLQVPTSEDNVKSLIKRILNINCPWMIKYPYHKLAQMITNNSTATDWLDRLINCLAILEKFGRNLLKPPEALPSDWRNISFRMHVVRTKVDIIQGARLILNDLGYTALTRVGVAYPANVFPDRMRVAPIVADIIMAHHELLGYYFNTHLYPSTIEELLHQHSRQHGNISVATSEKYSLPPPTWKSTVETTESPNDDPMSCQICAGPPMWFCQICTIPLCDDCDQIWHRHPARTQHNRSRFSPAISPGNRGPPLVNGTVTGMDNLAQSPPAARPGPPMYTSQPSVTIYDRQPAWSPTGKQELPTVIDSVRTFNSEEEEKLRSEFQRMTSTTDQHLPSGIPKMSVFLPSLSPTSPKDQTDQLKSEQQQLKSTIKQLTTEINTIIKADPDFYKDVKYKSLCAEREKASIRLDVVNESLSQNVSRDAPILKPQITTPPAVYVPPMFRVTTENAYSEPSKKDVIAPSGSPLENLCASCGCKIMVCGTLCSACRTDSQMRSPRNNSLPDKDSGLHWECEHCTYNNKPSHKKECEMCYNVSENPKYLDVSQNDTEAVKPTTPEHRKNSIATRLQQEEESIMIQKLIAKKQFEKTEQERRQNEQLSAQSHPQTAPSRTSPDPWPETKPPPRRSQSVINNGISRQEQEPMHKAVSMGNNLTSLQERPPWVDPEYRRRQEMKNQGKAVVDKLKIAERDNFCPLEFASAYTVMDEASEVMQYLRSVWRPTIEEVVRQVAALNTPPMKVSWTEAREALISAGGSIKQAVENCVHQRLEKVDLVMRRGSYEEGMVNELLESTDGSVEETLKELNGRTMQLFTERAWDEVDHDLITDIALSEGLLSDTVDKERQLRMLLVEGKLKSWGRAEIVLRLFKQSQEDSQGEGKDWSAVQLSDIVEIVGNGADYRTAITLLQQECVICTGLFPETKMKSLVCCECKVCGHCLHNYFEIKVREQHVRHWTCPVCSQPDIDDEEQRDAHFEFMELQLKNVVKEEVYELFQKKLRDWTLMNDPNFRWCSHCDFGFLFNSEDVLKMTCVKCKRHTCFQCKKPWEDQHEDLSCEQFQAWKEANDPELQAQGLAKILAENGIDCPACKFRYSLAKGGCMHFICSQCQHEFCSGCHRPFKRGETCGKFDTCKMAGLHCHHPRDCLFYLRDFPVARLQKLLTDHDINYNTANMETDQGDTCPVLEQKEQVNGLIDEACGREVPQNHAGLCEIHYKEYLVSLINKNHIDPLEIMAETELIRLFERSKIPIPPKRRNNSAADYRERLFKEIQEKLPLPPAPNAPQQADFAAARAPHQLPAKQQRPAHNARLPPEGIRRVPEENAEEAVQWI